MDRVLTAAARDGIVSWSPASARGCLVVISCSDSTAASVTDSGLVSLNVVRAESMPLTALQLAYLATFCSSCSSDPDYPRNAEGDRIARVYMRHAP